MIKKYKNHLILHFTILIWGFTGIIGKILGLSGLSTSEVVFWRMLIAWTNLLVYLLIKKQRILVSKKTLFKLLGNGVLIAFHWYCFFEAIALSNVSIALVFMSTTAFFTSFARGCTIKPSCIYHSKTQTCLAFHQSIKPLNRSLSINICKRSTWRIWNSN